VNRAPTLAVAILLSTIFLSPYCLANNSRVARKGVNFLTRCFSDSLRDCKPLRIASPDGQKFVEVVYRKFDLENGDYIMLAHLLVTTEGRTTVEVGPCGLVEVEVQWSADSSSFFINGSDGGEGPERIAIYRLGDSDSTLLGVIAAQRDMMKSFPPCRAKGADPKLCRQFAEHPEEINVSAIDWTQGSSVVVVMAEMPCSSAFGGIMCQVLGYEVEVSSGKVLRRMEAREFARRWQHSMAFKFHVPDPPEYETTKGSTPD
jgi:hypothetical protein